jgi:hypothetical protein
MESLVKAMASVSEGLSDDAQMSCRPSVFPPTTFATVSSERWLGRISRGGLVGVHSMKQTMRGSFVQDETVYAPFWLTITSNIPDYVVTRIVAHVMTGDKGSTETEIELDQSFLLCHNSAGKPFQNSHNRRKCSQVVFEFEQRTTDKKNNSGRSGRLPLFKVCFRPFGSQGHVVRRCWYMIWCFSKKQLILKRDQEVPADAKKHKKPTMQLYVFSVTSSDDQPVSDELLNKLGLCVWVKGNAPFVTMS